MKKSVIVALAFAATANAQEADTLHMHLRTMQRQLDSLRRQVVELEQELYELKRSSQKQGELDELISVLNEDDDENRMAPEKRRSRRKRVDDLLQAITERPGQLRFNGGATTSIQWGSQQDDFVTGVGSFDIFAHTSFGAHTLMFFDLEAIGGNGPNERLASFSSLNGDAGSTQSTDNLDRLTILEAWAEFTALNQVLTFTVGKIDLTNYFDNNAAANDETTQFLSGAFVNSAAFPAPDNSPGMRLTTVLLKRFFLQVGLSSMDNSGDRLFEQIFKIGSVGFKVLPESSWETNLRFYGYLHPAAGDAAGYGVSADGMIAGAFNVFGRYGRNEDSLANWFGIASAWSLGAQLRQTFMQRDLTIGVAFGKSHPRETELANERLFELYIRYPMNEWVYISPHLQRIWQAGGSSETWTFLGFRTHFNF